MSIVKPQTVEELKGMFIELLMNHTDKVTKVAPLSTLNGIAYGTAKLGQRVLKDVALIETHLFPDLAYGKYLDKVAENFGISPRFGSSESSTYIRVVGTPGTTYTVGLQEFFGNNGVKFDITETFSIPNEGFGYVKVRSQSKGSFTNVEPLSITRVSPVPIGHKYCINEYSSFGGRDIEEDEDFRKRIKEGSNIIARGTLSMLEQVFNKINNNVLKCYFRGWNKQGQVVIQILTQNGIDLNNSELNELLLKGKDFFSLTELKPDGQNGYGIKLENVSWFAVDISVRIELESNVNVDDVRKEIQIRLNKYFDYRYFDKPKVEWDDLLGIVKSVPGVRYVLDNYFFPQQDVVIPKNQLPRVRGFLLLNPDGSIITNSGNTLNPIYYPSTPDISFQKTIYSSI